MLSTGSSVLGHAFAPEFRALRHYLTVFSRLGTSEAPTRSDPLSKFVDCPLFSIMVHTAIVLNCVFMAIAADQEMHAALSDPDSDPIAFVQYGELFFLAVYSLEITVKLWRYRLHYFYDTSWKYNWLDISLLLLGFYSTLFQSLLPNFSWLRMLRMFKMAKALRVFHLIDMVKPLRAILRSIISTADALAWSMLMLLVILFMFALILVIQVTGFLQEESDSLESTTKLDLEMAYGSVGVTIVHLFMSSTGGQDWGDYYEPLRQTGAVNCALFLFFIAFTHIALLNIILGVFVDGAMKNLVAQRDEKAEEHAVEQREIANELKQLFHELDTDSNGKLSSVELRRAVKTPKIQNQLELLDFRASEVKEFIGHMCAGNDEDSVDIETFVCAIMRFRGSASCYDMQIVLHAIDELKVSLLGAHKVQ